MKNQRLSSIDTATLDRVFEGIGLTRVESHKLLRFALFKATEQDEVGMVSACYFAHATFEDFCVAYWLAKQFQSERSLPEAKKFVQQNRYNSSYRLVWPFLAGLLRITATADAKEGLKCFFDALSVEPRDLGPYETSIFLACLEECIPAIPVETDLTVFFNAYRFGGKIMPIAWLQALKRSPNLLKRTGFLESLQRNLETEGDQNYIIRVNAAIQLAWLGDCDTPQTQRMIEILSYCQAPSDLQERATMALLEFLSITSIETIENFIAQSGQKLWQLAGQANTTLVARQLALKILARSSHNLLEDRLRVTLNPVLKKGPFSVKIHCLVQSLAFFPFVPKSTLQEYKLVVSDLIDQLSTEKENQIQAAYAIGYYCSLALSLENIEFKKLTELKLDSMVNAVMVAAMFPGSTEAQKAVEYIQTNFS